MSGDLVLGAAWRPIESAPKDGRLVLLYPSRCWAEDVDGDCEVGYWNCDKWIAMGPIAVDYRGPSHWMPLPPPPSVGSLPTRKKAR